MSASAPTLRRPPRPSSPPRAAAADTRPGDRRPSPRPVPPPSPERERRPAQSRRLAGTATVLTYLLPGVIAGLLVVGGLAVGYVQGWRGSVVSTASMGRTAPVGSFVVTRPVAPAAVSAGDVVVFHPPGEPGETFVHRVVAVRPQPGGVPLLSTRGDLSGSLDPWTLRADALVGRATTVLPVVGWVLRLAPWLLGGTVALLVLTGGMRLENRRAARILGSALVVVATVWHYRPLVQMELVSYGTTRTGTQITAVPTGILPIRVRAAHHAVDTAYAGPGQLFTDHTVGQVAGRVEIVARPWLHGWWLLVLVAIALPLLAGLVTERDPDRPADPAD